MHHLLRKKTEDKWFPTTVPGPQVIPEHFSRAPPKVKTHASFIEKKGSYVLLNIRRFKTILLSGAPLTFKGYEALV